MVGALFHSRSIPRPGQIWAEKYRIVGLVGAGAMGRVVAADHLILGGRVALKFLSSDSLMSSSKRFIREAAMTRTLSSEHVVRLFDVGFEGKTPYLVMELLDGEDLGACLRRSGPFSVSEGVDYVIQACAGVAAAHAEGVIHRDIKPSNLFRAHRSNGQPLIKVLDFGISKRLAPHEPSSTATRSLLGSPLFMSPEQLRNPRHVDERTDVWSLAITLHTLLHGQPPFTGKTIADLSIAIATKRAATLDGLPDAVTSALVRALAKRPEQRTPNVIALARDLAELASPIGQTLAEHLAAQYAPRRAWCEAHHHEPGRNEERRACPDARQEEPSFSYSSHPTATDASARGLVADDGFAADRAPARAAFESASSQNRKRARVVLFSILGGSAWLVTGETAHHDVRAGEVPRTESQSLTSKSPPVPGAASDPGAEPVASFALGSPAAPRGVSAQTMEKNHESDRGMPASRRRGSPAGASKQIEAAPSGTTNDSPRALDADGMEIVD